VVDTGTVVVVDGGKLDVVVVASPAPLEQAVSKSKTTRRFIYRMALRNPSREPR
jgi:hypothetical protein